MKFTHINRPLYFGVFFLLISHILAFIGIFTHIFFTFGPGEFVPRKLDFLIDVPFQIANWPSILLRTFPLTQGADGNYYYISGNGIFNPLVILTNAIGWGIFGAMVGFISSLILKWRNRNA